MATTTERIIKFRAYGEERTVELKDHNAGEWFIEGFGNFQLQIDPDSPDAEIIAEAEAEIGTILYE
jgi:hypothetical protein